MMSHRDLAESFANGATNGKGSRMFIENDTIYSYGYHFPIARRKKGYYIFNNDSYSSSTSRHKNYVETALSNERVIKIKSCDENLLEEQIKSNEERIEVLRKKILNARTIHKRHFHQTTIFEIQDNNKLIKEILENENRT